MSATACAAHPTPRLDLSALVAQVLLCFTIDFEAESKISLPISANALQVANGTGVRVRDLPRLTGVSKQANIMSIGFLERHGCVVIEPDPSASRGKLVRLTPKGQKAQVKYRRILAVTEDRWTERFGEVAIGDLRESLERLVGDEPDGQKSLLLQGLSPTPTGGGHRSAGPTRSRTTRWSFTAADIQMAADLPHGAGKGAPDLAREPIDPAAYLTVYGSR